MQLGKIVDRWKTIVVIALLLMLPLSGAESSEGNPSPVPSWLRVEVEDPLEFLKDFTLVPDSIVVIDEKYIFTLFQNATRKGLYAVVVFAADCSSGSCAIATRDSHPRTDRTSTIRSGSTRARPTRRAVIPSR
jgi:hypothetical protein